MRTSKQIVFIILERGFEDVGLLKELKDLVATSDVPGIEFVSTFPLVHELIQLLKHETTVEAKEGEK